ncbi:MAG: DUF421 domain-containing protein [Chitinophagaceae bacterium]|nr:MAG: DUF421 domain-containing protein [Chitinophagaceae bacterium]
MFFLQTNSLDWQKILLGEEEWSFLPEVLLRTSIMFLVALTALRILGKRGVRQLSVFELVVIITLGSAAGDPMFYKDVGVLPAIGVFMMVVLWYLAITYLVGKSKKFERLIEGKPVCLIEQGAFAIDNFKKESLAQDEFFAELRVKGVSQLGQIELAVIETNGDISIFFYEDKDVVPGLSILPGVFKHHITAIPSQGVYACTFCGNTESIPGPKDVHVCDRCKKNKWTKASLRKRIS